MGTAVSERRDTPDIFDRTKFRRMVKSLNLLAAPTDGLMVQVRLMEKMPNDTMADCSKHDGYYRIRIMKSIAVWCPEAAYLLLSHEWAHIMSWDSRSPHGAVWGIEMARCWRIITGEFNISAFGDDFD